MTYPSLGLRVARRAFGSLVIGLFLPDGGVIEHLALVYPCLDADDAVRGMCFGKPVVDIGAQGMQRHPTLAVPFTSRSDEHTSAIQSLMRHPYAVFCLQTKQKTIH